MKNDTTFNKIGGVDTVNRAVDILLDKIIKDPELSGFFTNTDLRRLKLKKRMFFMMILGGPVHYTSKDLSTAHAGFLKMGLNKDHFKKYLQYLNETLTSVGISEEQIKEFLITTSRFEAEILSGKQYPPMRREVTVSSLKEYIEVTSQFNENTLFRGQGSSSWNLIPSIARIGAGQKNALLNKVGGWSKLEEEIMKRFIRHSSPLLKYTPTSTMEWMVLAQHHGLPTRLLDWSQNPLVSLYFALSSSAKDESIVWALDPKFVYGMDIDLNMLEDLQVYFPKNIDSKLVSQKGCFTLQPLPKGNDEFIPLEKNRELLNMSAHSFSKITIPNDNQIKQDILIQLANCGVDETFIYPDLYGLSRQIRRDLELGIIKF